MAPSGIDFSCTIAWTFILCISLSWSLELNGENGTRISVLKKYRIQRRLAAPEVHYQVEENSRESEEQSRKPKRKLIYSLSNHKKSKKPTKPTLLRTGLINKAFLKGLTKNSGFSGSLTKGNGNRLGFASVELNEIRINRKPQRDSILPYPIKEDEDEDEDIYSDSPAYALDPAHPALTAINHNPLAPFNPISHFPGLPPAPAPIKKKKHAELTQALFPLDKTHLTVGIVVGWIFWLGAFLAYYYWGEDKSGKVNLEVFGDLSHRHKMDTKILSYPQKPIIVKIEPGQPPQFFQSARSLGGASSFNFARVLDMIAIAQETYEKFDFQSLDCQKKALCELQQKQSEFGETGRKISSTFSFMDALEGLPVPTIIQTYLKEYKEAILQGKNSTKECASIYPKCGFSIKEVFVKYSKKSKLN